MVVMVFEVISYGVFAGTAVLLGIAAYRLRKSLRLFKAPARKSNIGLEVDLPSVTVCVPARNEQHALTDCLQRILASSYERLEIIVLDDVSGDDTSALIKSFASEGVRFVKGQALPDGWLGKNHALEGLLKEASGSYLLFVDVDTRLSPDAIENMVRYTLSHRASMLSVLPRREDGWRASVIFSPLRYLWELLFDRKNSPASASNAWLIRRSVLQDVFGGFETFKNAIQPEAKIADALAGTGEYKFLMSSAAFGVGFEKKWRSQLVTSVRLLFPLLGKQVRFAILAAILLVLLLWPFVVFGRQVLTFGLQLDGLTMLSLILILFSFALYGVYVNAVWSKGWFVGMLLWPYLLIQEIVLIIASVVQYKRRIVTWKGRIIRPEAQN